MLNCLRCSEYASIIAIVATICDFKGIAGWRSKTEADDLLIESSALPFAERKCKMSVKINTNLIHLADAFKMAKFKRRASSMALAGVVMIYAVAIVAVLLTYGSK